ncbi:MAG: bifunctional fucokinase/fucose-1-phosphate guanylyltransferase [Aliiglaciecola sp.]|uniref:bifunctional fucokinase/fucose-1-phosphate guanylyltransferase n=1 Tax=Aliiglaciecola sp. TaxID=1872441 RepID=UPI003299D952
MWLQQRYSFTIVKTIRYLNNMKNLLSLPPNLTHYFHQIENKDQSQWFCSSDLENTPLGSGGGTSWLLKQCWQNDNVENFSEWLGNDKRIIIHAGGQSRRLPSYAPSGKILTPIPIFRWERGQKIDQNLLDLQVPLYKKILEKTPSNLNTVIASGDVYIRSEGKITELPDVDIACYGLWVNAELAKNHGVFVCDKSNPQDLLYMLQKPSIEELQELSQDKLYLMDIGIWVLSDKAIEVLVKRSGYSKDDKGNLVISKPLNFYDLYGDFGLEIGQKDNGNDPELNDLSVAILPLPKGEFYHFGTSKELISSTLAIQNRVIDQRVIFHKDAKPHPSMFIQNAEVKVSLHAQQRNLWIENSFIGEKWELDSNHIITGIPQNDWEIKLPNSISLDIVPIDEDLFCIRPYGFNDKFRGEVGAADTNWMESSIQTWLSDRDLSLDDLSINERTDIQSANIFPVVTKKELTEALITFMLSGGDSTIRSEYVNHERISATDISDRANLKRLYAQREAFRKENYPLLHKNFEKSVIYQIDLDDVAKRVAKDNIQLSNDNTPSDPFLKMHEFMFQAKIKQYQNKPYSNEEQKAFNILQENIINTLPCNNLTPELNVYRDQIVWGRSPIRIDLAGGWTDTPPYSLMHGGAVVNMAIELNGQPPLQVYIKPSKEKKIILRSIDIGTREDISTYEELSRFDEIGSAFSIPKGALCLAGFHPNYSANKYNSLIDQLNEFGSGIEISTLAAIPKGSGLGTSSILAATVLGALSDFCGFAWDRNEVSHRTLVLEQLLTTGGGWQDQYGGVLPGIKLIHTEKGNSQLPEIKWAPEFVFSNPENKAKMLLYYTGITRVAKNILSEIVKGMFLNENENNALLAEMKQHAFDTFDVLQRGNFDKFSNSVAHTWLQNQQLDAGTNPPEVQKIISHIDDYTSSYKLPGAGGGGYILIIAKDQDAAGKIRQTLISNPPNNLARFVDIDLSRTGLQVTRS